MNNTKKLFESIQSNIKESEDLDKCIYDYSQYVDAHIANVQKAWKEEVSLLKDDFINSNKEELTNQIANHDKSKWSEEEFDAYRANYNPINDQEKVDNEANFQAAWFHHFHDDNNMHHWQHWTDESGELLPLEDIDLVKRAYIEMICDWQAMGYVFGDTAKQYYDSNKDTIKIYPDLQDWLYDLLTQLENSRKETIKESESFDNNGVHLDFPFYAIKVTSLGNYTANIGYFTRFFKSNGDTYPGTAYYDNIGPIDTGLNFLKKYKTEANAQSFCDRTSSWIFNYSFEPKLINNIDDLSIK